MDRSASSSPRSCNPSSKRTRVPQTDYNEDESVAQQAGSEAMPSDNGTHPPQTPATGERPAVCWLLCVHEEVPNAYVVIVGNNNVRVGGSVATDRVGVDELALYQTARERDGRVLDNVAHCDAAQP